MVTRSSWEVACHAEEYFATQEREESHDKCYSEKEEPWHSIPRISLREALQLPDQPWSDIEHQLFLRGQKKLGKGDWRGISRKFVVSRCPWEVACHAEEYFTTQEKYESHDKCCSKKEEPFKSQEKEESHDKCYSEKEEPLHLIPNMNLKIRVVLKLPVYPWRDAEHQLFLLGLKRLGKGDWYGISAKYVTTRTPREVASHAEVYFTTKEKEESNDG